MERKNIDFPTMINSDNLIKRFEDMANRNVLLTGPNVTQDDLLAQIIGTIIKERISSSETTTNTSVNNEPKNDFDIPNRLKNEMFMFDKALNKLSSINPQAETKLAILLEYGNSDYKDIEILLNNLVSYIIKKFRIDKSIEKYDYYVSKHDIISMNIHPYYGTLEFLDTLNKKEHPVIPIIHKIDSINCVEGPIWDMSYIIECLRSCIYISKNTQDGFIKIMSSDGIFHKCKIMIITCNDKTVFNDNDFLSNTFNFIYNVENDSIDYQ